MMYSDYSGTGLNSLDGAKFDLQRLKIAFEENGFECWALLDPNEDQLYKTLQAFSSESENHDFAMFYTTGHGVEYNQIMYLLPSTYQRSYGKEGLSDHAHQIPEFLTYLRARKGNFLFYGGCREYIG